MVRLTRMVDGAQDVEVRVAQAFQYPVFSSVRENWFGGGSLPLTVVAMPDLKAGRRLQASTSPVQCLSLYLCTAYPPRVALASVSDHKSLEMESNMPTSSKGTGCRIPKTSIGLLFLALLHNLSDECTVKKQSWLYLACATTML